MIGTKGFLTDGQRSLVERLGIRIATLIMVHVPQDCSAKSQHRVIGTEGFLTDGQRSLVERLGIRIATFMVQTTPRLFSDVATLG